MSYNSVYYVAKCLAQRSYSCGYIVCPENDIHQPKLNWVIARKWLLLALQDFDLISDLKNSAVIPTSDNSSAEII